MKPLDILILLFFGATIVFMLCWQGIPLPALEPEPPLAITLAQYEKLSDADKENQYEKLSDADKENYGLWKWQDVTFWCPHCGAQYTLKVKPRTEYFRYMEDDIRYFINPNGYGFYFPDVSFWVIQLTRMEVPGEIPVAGVSGYR